MAVQQRPPQGVEEDLEATAELPVIDFTAGAAAELPALSESAVSTDVFAAPVGVAELAESLRDVERRLERKLERVQELESQLAGVRGEEAARRAELEAAQRSAAERDSTQRAALAEAEQRQVDLQRELAEARSALTEARTQLSAQHAALGETQQQVEQRARAQRHLERDAQELRRRGERTLEALATWQGFRGVVEAQVAERDDALRGIEGRHAAELAEAESRFRALEATLAEARQSSATRLLGLEEQLRRSEQALATQTDALKLATEHAAQQAQQLAMRDARVAELEAALATLRAQEEKASAGARVYDAQLARIAELEADAGGLRERLQAAEEHAHAALERVRRLESEAHASAALLGNLQQNIERLGRDDTGTRPVLKAVPEPVVRVFIRQDSGADVVYPVGKRTTIGRTPENDIQVDTTFVSRHHAVLLSSPDHCIVEDLNSTNGVLVNGRRVGRQILQDGDTVTIGRTEFRYQQRS